MSQPLPPYWQEAPAPRRRRRVFAWVFLAVQALFAVWVIAGIASGGGDHGRAAAAWCRAHPSAYVSFSECVSLYGSGSRAGTAIGAGLVVLAWAVTDVILGISYAVWRLARR